ncbi:Uncharacterised protein [Mycolicibacterium aichiense]|nr:Uncharacterised protein [Mycolicibacterium aichiense]
MTHGAHEPNRIKDSAGKQSALPCEVLGQLKVQAAQSNGTDRAGNAALRHGDMNSNNRLDSPADRRFRGTTVPVSRQAATRTSYDGRGRCCQTLGRIHATHFSRWPPSGCRGVLVRRRIALRWTPVLDREPFSDAAFGLRSRRIARGAYRPRPCRSTAHISESPAHAVDGSTGQRAGRSGGCGLDHRGRLRGRALEARTNVVARAADPDQRLRHFRW